MNNFHFENQKIPHAILFYGPQSINLQKAAYQVVSSLIKVQNIENHPDVHLFFPEGKTQLHPINSIRQLTQDAILVPYVADRKVFILHEAEKMLPTSSNALLKILEEPPSKTVIILLSSSPGKLLPTIYSRCQRFAILGPEKNIDPATLDLLAGNVTKEKIAQFDSSQPDAVFETLLLWFRDRWILEIQGCDSYLHFPEYISQIQKSPLIPLETIEAAVKKMRLGFERSTKLSTCLEMFFHYIHLITWVS